MCLLRAGGFTRIDTASIFFLYNRIVKCHEYYIFWKYLIECNYNIELFLLQFIN